MYPFRSSFDVSSTSFRQNRISGSLDDMLTYEDMQSVKISFVKESSTITGKGKKVAIIDMQS